MAETTKTQRIFQERETKSASIQKILANNSVTLLFVIICIAGVIVSKLPAVFIANELIVRIARDSFLVLALIIPVMAGMGLNFSITIGAMAAQAAIIFVTHLGVPGIWGLLLCVVICTPLAILFGFLTGKLLNKTRGQEMIASMFVGYFANGIYQFVFLFIVGGLIPIRNEALVLSDGIGIRNTVDLEANNGIKYSLDNLWTEPVFFALIIIACIFLIYNLYKLIQRKRYSTLKTDKWKIIINIIFSLLLIIFSICIRYINTMPSSLKMMSKLNVPMGTLIVIGVLCLFNLLIVKTKLGQDFRTVGNNQHIAEVSGINVDKVRILAITISTVLAAWGQLIFLQNLGTLNTYGSHVQIATFSIAALLIGGASVSRATVGQALLGVVLFHTLFIVSPKAGQNLFGEAQIGEYFRAFVAYGVIGVSLGLHAWRRRVELKNKLKAR